jgi:hypothetical protein
MSVAVWPMRPAGSSRSAPKRSSPCGCSRRHSPSSSENRYTSLRYWPGVVPSPPKTMTCSGSMEVAVWAQRSGGGVPWKARYCHWL